jgi:flagellar L-ring protein precursor FlgH
MSNPFMTIQTMSLLALPAGSLPQPAGPFAPTPAEPSESVPMPEIVAFRSPSLQGVSLQVPWLKRRLPRLATATVLALAATACGAVDRLSQVGKTPALSAIEDPTAQPGYKPVQMPMPTPEPVSFASNSLWRQGSRAFFKDQRARQIGDLVTVRVRVTDKAAIANATKRGRDSEEKLSNAKNFGFETEYHDVFPEAVDQGDLYRQKTESTVSGSGSVTRSESLLTNVAAVVTQALPNGNLVIEGKQEIRVNFEIRELIVAGVIRPEDIEADNTIDSAKIAQARIAYGGRGQITDVQQPRYGTQVMDIILPF